MAVLKSSLSLQDGARRSVWLSNRKGFFTRLRPFPINRDG
jgi:hypothetical protein